ncbi:hypothetical protein [Streptomyces sp. NPDC057636]|uniref:hypothetical protein n=1 Tax=Streptomyces sp. NPDC057636 TaxID=3346189 RepID=UPI0036881F8E
MTEVLGLTKRYGPTVAVDGLGEPGVLRAVVLSGAYLATVGLLGIALGAVVRHRAAAVGALVGLLYVLPAAPSGLTGVAVAKYFPTMIAGNSLAVSKPVADVLSPWVGFGCCAYAYLQRSAQEAGC